MGVWVGALEQRQQYQLVHYRSEQRQEGPVVLHQPIGSSNSSHVTQPVSSHAFPPPPLPPPGLPPSLPHRQGDAVAGKGDVARPVAAHIRQVAAGAQAGGLEGRLAQHQHLLEAHNTLLSVC